jgi:hypothetical protein
MVDSIDLKELNRADWTFRGVKAKEGIHGIHSYPAMMAPPVARRLIAELTSEGDWVLDPFCGSGTVLAEAALLKRKAIGYDINPLALLIAKVKTTPLEPRRLRDALRDIGERFLAQAEPPYIPRFPNIEYWFKPEVITALARLKFAIEAEEDENVRDFFKVVFARVVRHTSNTKGNEFKLFRLPLEKLEFFKPDVFSSFGTIALECISIMDMFHSAMEGIQPEVEVRLQDARMPLPLIEPVSLMLTSPPYGDSKTTVAYGQFSRLALQWLGMWDRDVDRECLGGRAASLEYRASILKNTLAEVRVLDVERAKEVEAFYQDLYLCLKSITNVIKPEGFAAFVIANRKVKGIVLPSDKIIVEAMETFGFQHLTTFHREIPNKRMPSRNSPSNIPGQTDATMLKEHIVLLRKGES